MSSGVGVGKGVDPGPGFGKDDGHGKGVYGMAQASDAARVWMALTRVSAQAMVYMALANEYALALELAPHGMRGQQGMNTHDAGV